VSRHAAHKPTRLLAIGPTPGFSLLEAPGTVKTFERDF
jgi:hypothetical protein